MSTDTRLVFTTVPDAALAESLAQQLIELRLAACVKAMPACKATYRWEGQIERGTEIPLIIVTHRAAYSDLERHLKASHPYDVPEILAVDCSEGLPDYLRWVVSASSPNV